ncbi:MAG: dienelactone hydrolase family protein [Acidobacteriota bacterium]|nr:dienelactone hydrolase family protein [Acidobacteriota bacterium]
MAAPLEAREHRVPLGEREVSALWLRPRGAVAALALAHGAGAGMRHPFLEGLAQALAAADVASLRYQFPYMEAGRRYPDRPPLATATVRAAVAATKKLARGLPLLAGGKSFGARMSSQAAADGGLESALGLVFFGFPLHPPGKPGSERAAHLERVGQSMLFLQGTRDAFADLDLLAPVCRRLGDRATLHVVDGADHGFAVPRRSGRAAPDVLGELAAATRRWIAGL